MSAQSNLDPVVPIRTNTLGSQSSSDLMSAPTSPTSPSSHTSRAASDFFGAITARVRGRSTSRSREASCKQSKPPLVSPPRQIAPPQHARTSSTTTTTTTPAAPTRPSLLYGGRRSTSGSDMWRGRHSNEWLFGGWSATETAKDFLNRRKYGN